MKFAALLKKELRICLPWLLLGTVVFVVIGSLMMQGMMLSWQANITHQQVYRDGWHWSAPRNPISEFAALILIISLALGLILGVVQFFLPGLFKTWAFTIHRSIKPNRILWSKFAAAGITFLISLGLFWTLFYSYAAVPGRFHMPIFFRTYLEGWIYILAGLIAYWGTALSSVSTAHTYTTRLLGLVIATGAVFLMVLQTSITGAVIAAAAGAFVLIIQIFHTFLSREF
ncbi:MAG: hypothetical protein ACYSTR_08650 [Planctomycetota bacterium]|jgi:MFS family permease